MGKDSAKGINHFYDINFFKDLKLKFYKGISVKGEKNLADSKESFKKSYFTIYPQ
jgi:hypothetical protein